ncbi:MAG TPA: methyl-accepting chemotaxis protein [Janthinobacterium sp.]|nr:methyl-accepting chemotaxis protein [Janthinobacterium sp.]
MKNLNIGVRLGIGFAAVLLLLVALTVIGVMRMQTASAMTDTLINVKVKNERMIAEWVKVIELNASRTTAAWQISDPADQKAFEDQMKTSSARATEVQNILATTIQDPRAKALYEKVLSTRQIYTDTRRNVFKAKAAGDLALGKKLYEGEMVAQRTVYLDTLNQLFQLQQKLLDMTAEDIQREYHSGRMLLIVLGISAVLLGVGFAYWITRSITGPIGAAVRVAESVSSGDLSSDIVSDTQDETGKLMASLKRMNENLVNIVGQVRSGTETIATASSQIAAGNLDLSSRTEQQASSLEETASSMEELTSTVKFNADNAHQARQLAIEASEIASRGGAVVAEVVTTMGSINESSRKIADIISVIDGIAFQTNILALNAAVEAARAGEQGRGFAVVAGEVRNLAQRSAAAAREIKGLIDDSVQKVTAGSGLVDKAGHTMDEIVQSIANVTQIMNQITDASDEQRAGIEQINQAVNEMDHVTQQNAALVEEAAAAAESMQKQSARLAEVVSIFKLDAAHMPAAAAPLRSPGARPAIAAAPRRVTAAVAPRVVKPAKPSASTSSPASPRVAVASSDASKWEEF